MIKSQQHSNIQQYIRLCILVALSLSCLYRGYAGLLLHQLNGAVLMSPKSDNLMWLLMASGYPQALVGNYSCCLLADLGWLLLVIACILRPKSLLLSSLAYAFFVHYFLVFKCISIHHEHQLNGLLLAGLLLLLPNKRSFEIGHELLRFYTLFVMVSAFGWKLVRGSLWIDGQMSEILKHQHLQLLTQNTDSYYSQFIHFLIIHPSLSNCLWVAAWVLEASFLVGFFSRKWDKYLAVLFLAFFLMDYIIMQLVFFEFCILIVVFWSKPLYDSQNKPTH